MSSSTTNTPSNTPAVRQTQMLANIPQFSQKLTASNYLLWRLQLEPMLRGHGLFHHVDGTVPPPSQTRVETSVSSVDDVDADSSVATPNPDYESWYQQDQIILTLITFSVSSELLPQIVGCTTARETWQRLAQVYASTSRANIRCLKTSLDHIKKGADSIDKYLLKVKTLKDQLAALGHIVAEDDLVDKVLAGLPEEYRPFIRNVEARIDPVALADLHAQLLSEELNLQRSATVAADLVPSANFGARSTTRGGRSGRGNGRFHGGRGSSSSNGGRGLLGSHPQGFSNRETRFSSAPGRTDFGQRTSSDVQCHNCRGFGHLARDCSSARRHAPSRPQAHHTTSPHTSPWVLDSGTTHHLTSDLGNLAIHSEYTGPDEVTFGNGESLPISSTGHTSLYMSNSRLSLSNILHVPHAHNNLVSLSALTRDNPIIVEFVGDSFFIKDQDTKKILHQGRRKGGLYSIQPDPPAQVHFASSSPSQSLDVWHHRFGHAGLSAVKHALRAQSLPFSNKHL